jgi:hypothetical protein
MTHPAAPNIPRQVITYKGLTVDVTATASLPNRDSILYVLRRQIDIVDSVTVPPDARAVFTSVGITMRDGQHRPRDVPEPS